LFSPYNPRFEMNRSAFYSLGIAKVRLDHHCGIDPPQPADHFVPGQPAVSLLQFVAYGEFGSVNCQRFGPELIRGRNVTDERISGSQFVLENQSTTGIAEGFGCRQGAHHGNELKIHDLWRDGFRLGRSGQRLSNRILANSLGRGFAFCYPYMALRERGCGD
jgi:hypothetical protein